MFSIERVCPLCNDDKDLYHVVMACVHYGDIRLETFNRIHNGMLPESRQLIRDIPQKNLFYILMNTEYPVLLEGLWHIRCNTCKSGCMMCNGRRGLNT